MKVYTSKELMDMGFAFNTNGEIVTPDKEEEILNRYIKYREEKIIDKVCEWFKCIDFEVDYFTTDSDGYTFFNADKFIEDFRKTMEE